MSEKEDAGNSGEFPHSQRITSIFACLAAPFDVMEVKSRTQAGRHLPYVTARTVMNRLDDAVGPTNWWDEYVPGENSVLCRLTIRMPDGQMLTKADAGGYAGMSDSGDDDKSGYSDAFKRAAVKFGVGRYLYRDGVPAFIAQALGENPSVPQVDGSSHHSDAHDAGRRDINRQFPNRSQGQPNGQNGSSQNGGSRNGNAPRTGKALFAWTKEKEQQTGVGLLKYLNDWAKLQDFPGRMVEWDADQVALAFAEATRKLQNSERSHADSGYEEALSN